MKYYMTHADIAAYTFSEVFMMGKGRVSPLAAGVAAIVLISGCSRGEQAADPAAMPPPQVEAIAVQPRSLVMTQEYPGRITPARVAEVRARVAGIVLSRHFEEGADVKAGQLLFRIDPAPLKAALSRAQGDLARAEATLADTQAVVKRYEPLVKIEAVSQQDFDAATASFKSAQAARTSALADVETAQLSLDYATVKAPISGRIGRSLVTEGALVGQGETTALATIQQLNPIYADFTQPVAEALRLRDAMGDGRLAREAPAEAGKIKVTLEGTDKVREGKLKFSDISVDRTSGQISVRGEFANQDGLLLPGMYVRVTTSQGVNPQAILVPQRAVKRSTDGKPQVFALGEGDVVDVRLVKTGAMYGSDWLIVDGLKAGDRVIVGGPAVNPGDKVTVGEPKPATQGGTPVSAPASAPASAGG